MAYSQRAAVGPSRGDEVKEAIWPKRPDLARLRVGNLDLDRCKPNRDRITVWFTPTINRYPVTVDSDHPDVIGVIPAATPAEYARLIGRIATIEHIVT